MSVSKKPGRRGEREVSRKPPCREGRIASAEPVCSCASSILHFARETAGAARIRLSLRPQGGGSFFQDSDALRRGIADVYSKPPTSSSRRTPGPITTGLCCCAKAGEQLPPKKPPRRMGPGVRRGGGGLAGLKIRS